MSLEDDKYYEHGELVLGHKVKTLQANLSGPATEVVDCVDCDDPIGQERKAANPRAIRCIDCETIREKHVKNPGLRGRPVDQEQ